MPLTQVFAPPPQEIYEACDRQFKVRGKRGIIWTIGGTLFNPDRAYIEPWLFRHEEVHSQRQLASGDIPAWWKQYLENREFRFAEELVAHREEARAVKELISSRQQRRQWQRLICARLSGPLYGHLVTMGEAKRLVLGRG